MAVTMMSVLLGCKAMLPGEGPTFQRKISPPSSDSNRKLNKKLAETRSKLNLLDLIFNPKDGGNYVPLKWLQYGPPAVNKASGVSLEVKSGRRIMLTTHPHL
jgi:hypothetical protein